MKLVTRQALGGLLAIVCAAGAATLTSPRAASAGLGQPDLSIGTSPVTCQFHRGNDPYAVPELEITVPIIVASVPSLSIEGLIDGAISMYDGLPNHTGPETFSRPTADLTGWGAAHTAGLFIDNHNQVVESDETNNRVLVTYTLPAQPPALRVDQSIALPCTATRDRTANNDILFYSASTGTWATAYRASNGVPVTQQTGYGFATNWSSIAPIGDGYTLFYAIDTGTYATAHRTYDGTIATDYVGQLPSSNWSNIAPLDNGYLLFYTQNSDQYAIGYRATNGSLVINSTGHGLSSNWTNVTSFGDGNVLFYAASTGTWATAHRSSGNVLATDTTGNGFATNWSSLSTN